MNVQWIDPKKTAPAKDARLIIELNDGRAYIVYYEENEDYEPVDPEENKMKFNSAELDYADFFLCQVRHYIPYPDLPQ